MLVGLILSSLLILGNIYCGSICPFAAVQETLFKLFQTLFPGSQRKISETFDQKARYIKYGVLFAALILSFIFASSDVAHVEVFIFLFTFHAPFWGWALVIVMVGLSLFYYRFWCRYFCPIGAFNGLVATLSFFRITVDESNCHQCEKCAQVCPTQAIRFDKNKVSTIDYPECILCGQCLQNCPEKTIIFGRKNAQSR